ncbi:MAG TPA: tetratricopeptide repeat protein, partial [Gallionella sp.]|nr:tetratricopeptide repeat protein [Gallionella sp.]
AILRKIGDKSGEGTTLNNISQIYDSRGDYATALDYLQQSLAIHRAVGDTAGLCTTLFNMGHIHRQNAEREEAMRLWGETYRIAKKINLANVLDALKKLAKQIDLPDGLAGWEKFSPQADESDIQTKP